MDVIDIWRLDLTVLDEDWDLLSPDETERARRIVVADKSGQKASSRAHLRRILSRYTDIDPAGLQFEYGEHGKPALSEHSNPSFNLSHSETVGLVAVTADLRIGIDVEHRRDGRDFSGLAHRFFSTDESAEFERLSEADWPEAFYRAWTRKEAYLKALGTGLSFPSNGFSIDFAAGGPGRVVSTDMPADDPSVWRFADIELGAHYAGALCFEGPDRPIRWWEIRTR